MRPLRICLLWHQHQPDYRDGNHMVLPWVRLHAVKDYLDLPLMLSEWPHVRHTMNVVPSLLAQLDAYAAGAQDTLLTLCSKEVDTLADADKHVLAHDCGVLQRSTMTHDLPRYGQLIDQIADHGVTTLSRADWLDLQVLYHLAWTGPVHRFREPFRRFVLQGAGYSAQDRAELLQAQQQIITEVIPTLRQLQDAGTLELSVTPFHHPILPLLCDTSVAVQRMPKSVLPDPPMSVPGDAQIHVQRALADATLRFHRRPIGIWPAEGSISMEALDIMVRHGLQWTASDEAVLTATLGDHATPTSALFPRRVITPSGSIAVLFRDHDLSDAIGFTYATWDPERAVHDFVRRLEERRHLIVSTHGEAALDHAVVPVMLDGENCWEFYPNNGQDFLQALLRTLSDTTRFTAVTCAEATADVHLQAMPDLTDLTAGSWIDGTFDVWIGSPVKNLAWSLLRDARTTYDAVAASCDPKGASEAFEHLLAAEGSDWFWWYDDRHQAPHKGVFDTLFRRRLAAAYRAMGVSAPEVLEDTLYKAVGDTAPGARIAVAFPGSAMHESDLVAGDVRLEQSGEWQRVVLALRRRPHNDESLTLAVKSRDGMERRCHIHADGLLWHSPLHDEGAHYLTDLEVAIYVHAGSMWHVRVDEERGSVRTFMTDLASGGA